MFSRNWQLAIYFTVIVFGLFGSVPAEAASATAQYTYDPLGRVTTALYDNGICVVYSYDANGNRTSQTNTAGNGVPPMTWGTGVWGCVPWTPS
ncbi:hypothetical protein D5R55_10720 [Burkholderia cenocepacia]|uniref:RHS repeat protein n=1 Tax=Burkholderia cenocepacia TaxID=95486 RepID=A0A3Q9F8J0_9BURK|nr:hypothetical protein D5R55_10720 [Burkholderia cenocepacia]